MEQEERSTYDFKKFLGVALQNKRNYLIVVVASAVLGLIVAFSIPKTYTTKIMLAPESSSDSKLGSLSSMASLVGMNLGGLSSDAIVPEIYPDVVRGTAFLVDLSRMEIHTKDNSVKTTMYDFLENHQKSPWWSAMFSFLKKKKEDSVPAAKLNAHMMTRDQSEVIKMLEESISCSVDQKTGVITLKASAQDPLVSTQLADTLSRRLQDFITDYRTNKARNDEANIKKLYVEAKQRYDKARQVYGHYADANQELTLESFKSKETDLENEMQLQYNIYTQLATQLQMARAKVIEKTPVYAVIQPSTVPYRQSAPKKIIVILGYVFVGLFCYSAYLMLRMGRKSKAK